MLLSWCGEISISPVGAEQLSSGHGHVLQRTQMGILYLELFNRGGPPAVSDGTGGVL